MDSNEFKDKLVGALNSDDSDSIRRSIDVNTFSDRTYDNEVPLDVDWMKNVFLIKDSDKPDYLKKNYYFTTGSLKFTDTSLGGDIALNPRYQFTRYADVPVMPITGTKHEPSVHDLTGEFGMGRYYSEAIDDNAQKVFFQFGVANFNSLGTFLTNGVDYGSKIIAKTGKFPTAYTIGKAMGAIFTFFVMPFKSIAIYITKFIYNLIVCGSEAKYYTLKPTMHIYWATVNTLLIRIGTELGLISLPVGDGNSATQKANVIGQPFNFKPEDFKLLKDIMPDVYTDGKFIDVIAVALRTQALANRQMIELYDRFNNDEDKDIDEMPGYIINKFTKGIAKPTNLNGVGATLNRILTLADYKTDESIEPGKGKTGDTDTTGKQKALDGTKQEINLGDQKDPEVIKKLKDKEMTTMAEYADAMFREGGSFAVFKIDYIGSVSDTFSNSVTEIPIKNKIKNLTNKVRDINFSLAGGNIVPGIGNVIDTVKDVAAGALDGATFGLSSVAMSLFDGAYLDIPDMWDDSSASFPDINIKFRLVSPYNNPVAQLQDLYLPLMAILAGVLPLSAGKNAYTSPFLCSAFVRGVANIKLGIITNVSINRGVSNLGYKKDWKPLAFDVSITVKDLTKIITAPVSDGSLLNFFSDMDGCSKIDDYIGTLTARSLYSDRYSYPKLIRRLSNNWKKVNSYLTPAAAVNRVIATTGIDNIITPFVGNYSLNLNDQ